jgi:hypothetical protein
LEKSWAAFWEIFSQSHLVTLLAAKAPKYFKTTSCHYDSGTEDFLFDSSI